MVVLPQSCTLIFFKRKRKKKSDPCLLLLLNLFQMRAVRGETPRPPLLSKLVSAVEWGWGGELELGKYMEPAIKDSVCVWKRIRVVCRF